MYRTTKLFSIIISVALCFFGITSVQTTTYMLYNENTDVEFIKQRAQLCDVGETKEPYRYHVESGKCWRGGDTGPCPINMQIYGINEVNGTCDCIGYDHEKEDNRAFIYHLDTDQCYQIFTQGYCKKGEWLTMMTPQYEPKCSSNPCLTHGSKDSMLYEETCVKIGHSCESFKRPRPIEEIKTYFLKFGYKPTCEINEIFYGGLEGFAPNLSCFPGSKMAVVGKCLGE